jgi:hypothetical protein
MGHAPSRSKIQLALSALQSSLSLKHSTPHNLQDARIKPQGNPADHQGSTAQTRPSRPRDGQRQVDGSASGDRQLHHGDHGARRAMEKSSSGIFALRRGGQYRSCPLVGFVHAGQDAEIKVHTFNFTRRATVCSTARCCTLAEPGLIPRTCRRAGSRGPDDLVYAARISLDQRQLKAKDRVVDLGPGMAVTWR